MEAVGVEDDVAIDEDDWLTLALGHDEGSMDDEGVVDDELEVEAITDAFIVDVEVDDGGGADGLFNC